MFQKYDVVEIVKNTRVKTKPGLKKAEAGKRYLVTSVYTYESNYGRTYVKSIKLFLCDESGENCFVSSANCAEKVFNLDSFKTVRNTEVDKWIAARKIWMDNTFVPVFAFHRYGYDGFPITTTKDRNAVLVSPMANKDKKVWVHKDSIHVEDIQNAFSSSFPPDESCTNQISSVFSMRVPEWFLKKFK